MQLEKLKDYLDKKLVVGIKLFTGHEEFYLTDERLKEVYELVIQYNVPVLSKLKSEGYSRLGVNLESFNPTALGFWLKYFALYTNSVVRRIDERITQRIL